MHLTRNLETRHTFACNLKTTHAFACNLKTTHVCLKTTHAFCMQPAVLHESGLETKQSRHSCWTCTHLALGISALFGARNSDYMQYV